MSDLTLAQWQHKAAHLTPALASLYRRQLPGRRQRRHLRLHQPGQRQVADGSPPATPPTPSWRCKPPVPGEDKLWRGLSPKQRKLIMQRFAELMRLNQVELAAGVPGHGQAHRRRHGL